MNYYHRLIEEVLSKVQAHFPVTVLAGVRQVGKSTLFAHIHPNIQHITFDPVSDIGNARQDPLISTTGVRVVAPKLI